jgi:glycosyltransferase involved in cell wall biosynthesis
VTTFHGSYAAKSAAKRLYNSVMARGDIVIANSGFTAGLLREVYGAEDGRVVTLQRGTDLTEFSPAAVSAERVDALRRKWEVAPHERIVLLAARLTGWKGQKVLIEAAAKLRDGGRRDIVYILAGDHQGRDGYVKELDRLIGDRGLAGMVRRVGHCADMPAAYLAASVVTVPSTEPEAFGRVAVEAQALGTPVVVSDLGAVPEPCWHLRRRPPLAVRAGGSRRGPRCAGRRARRGSWASAPAPMRAWHCARAAMSSSISRWQR